MSLFELPFNSLDENEFQSCMLNLSSHEAPRHFNRSGLYDDFIITEINARTQELNLDFDSDLTPIYNPSKYFTVNQFKSYSSENLNDELSLFHCNIRSMNRNFESLKLLLDSSTVPFSIIGLTETWITECQDQKLYSLSDYNFESKLS